MSLYDPDWVRSHYDRYAEKEWQRWDRGLVQQVKFEVHLHYLQQSIQPGDRVLEIGAGPGRFTQHLAQITSLPRTARIVVADISPVQLELNRQNARTLGFASAVERWVECDVCDLEPHFQDAEFDAVVCYGGALSYVFDQAPRAIGELTRVTKPGGVLLLEVMSIWGTVHHYLPAIYETDLDVNREIIAKGDLLPEHEAGVNYCHMYRAGEFRELLKGCGLAVEVLSASDCLAATWGEALESIHQDAEAWRFLIELELEACREPGCVDMGTHTIAVCTKPLV
jgi:ubiquinone/menaquinone biosynthesis C-methylase UbiE